jgi:hypothetical protein
VITRSQLPGALTLAELAVYERTEPGTQSLILIAIIQSSSAVPVAIPSAKENMSPSLMSAPADDQAMLQRYYRNVVPANVSNPRVPQLELSGRTKPHACIRRTSALHRWERERYF